MRVFPVPLFGDAQLIPLCTADCTPRKFVIFSTTPRTTGIIFEPFSPI